MRFTTATKSYINRWLRGVNLRIETLTADSVELAHLEALEKHGHFSKPVFPLPPAFKSMAVDPILGGLKKYSDRFDDFEVASYNDVGFAFDNNYFRSPDAEVLYAIVRMYQPETIIEIGSGNSTKVSRQAILDGQLHTRLISVDPLPRTEVNTLADQWYSSPVEELAPIDVFGKLKDGDILFVDSSHNVRTGNDVVFLYLHVIPKLPGGVLIHIHDIFLPYEYPKDWVMEKCCDWNEQYLVQAMLTFSNAFEVLWAGYFLQRTYPNFDQCFPHMRGTMATSLWLRKTG